MTQAPPLTLTFRRRKIGDYQEDEPSTEPRNQHHQKPTALGIGPLSDTQDRHQPARSAAVRRGLCRDTCRGQPQPRTAWLDMACKRSRPGDHLGTTRHACDRTTSMSAHPPLPHCDWTDQRKRLARSPGGQGVAGSNPAVPTSGCRSEAASPGRRGGLKIF
jgi:hypothetical protein